jgi:hypothetical protein
VAKAEAEEGTLQVADPCADGLLLGDEPGALLDVPNIHRAAHDPESVVALKRGNRLSGIELDGVPLHAVGGEELSQRAWMLAIEVLKHEQAH